MYEELGQGKRLARKSSAARKITLLRNSGCDVINLVRIMTNSRL
jgi:hypothetical protein